MRIAGMKLLTVAAAVALGLGLAGCGGGGSPTAGGPQPPGQTLEDRQTAQRAAISAAIDAASAAVAGVTDGSTDSEVGAAGAAVRAARDAIAAAADVPAPEKDADTLTVDVLASRLTAATASRTAAIDAADKAMKAAMAKLGKDMYAALGPPNVSNVIDALENIADPTLGPDSLRFFIRRGAGAIPDNTQPGYVTLKPGDSAGSLGGWAGTNYALTSGAGDAKVTDEARIYTNQGPAKTLAFADGLPSGVAIITTDGADKGYISVASGTDAARTRIMGSGFTHSGTRTHTKADRADAVYLRGTYLGAPGEYRCTGDDACTSTSDGKGSPTAALGGTWHFKPDAGATISRPDADYLFYGWWVRKDSDGVPVGSGPFYGNAGTVARGWGADNPPASLTGPATYAGKAAGKFAMSNPLDGTGDGGHFTADAEVKATFVGDRSLTGTIDNFRLNDGSEDPGWRVELRDVVNTTLPGFNGYWGHAALTKNGTVWSIDGNKAPASGAWQATFYDEQPGNPPAGDGSNVPTTVLGEFYSEFSTFGRMAGAFGAEKQ